MRIVTLTENTTVSGGLLAEHGLSFYIEWKNKKILFDCGQSDVFLKNAQKLGISVREADALVLSHGHYDHTGGLRYFLQENLHAPVFLKREALLEKYHGERYIGIDANLILSGNRATYINKIKEPDEGLFIIPQINIRFPRDVHFKGMSVREGTNEYADTFDDELFLALVTGGKITILSSCSHRGISNIIQTAADIFHLPVKTVIGGFHLLNGNNADTESIARYLNETNIENIGVCHCTGIEHYVILKNKCNGNVFYNQTGREIII